LGNMASQLRNAVGEIEIKVGRLDVVRDYVSLPFVATVFAAVAADIAAPAVVNACSGVGLELGSILDAMIDLSGADATVVSDPDLVALPAPPAVVGDPAMVIDRYGLRLRFDAESVARMVLALPSGS
jgi:GDP-4-dehydro-6-deoxy-D-mannose reductase